MTLYLSRARMRREPAIEALAPLLLPEEAGPRASASHRLVWSLFAGDRDADRDFLFRREDARDDTGRAGFLILSRREPANESPLFEIETKEFAPMLSPGDRLTFSLLANPAVNRTDPNRPGKIRRHDVVMDALKAIEKGDERRRARPRLIEEAGRAWLAHRAEVSGFVLCEDRPLRIDGYVAIEIARNRGRPIQASILQFEGVLEIRDPQRFMEKLTAGFGRARAFGCGLMLIRRTSR
jgi:CRISPR system Cascade subunit CasE